ncbi:hypothetical protein [Lentzea kentuckyensis]|uniref:hypothetical protein n=1 Tax=Lentzea kentuckyensis TaxID=360086 RepID=UPI00117A8121|nr:hypothetical protein [Lentzea kentuckyensis]
MLVTAAKCPPPSWLSNADNVIQSAPAADDILHGSFNSGSLRADAEELLRNAPKSSGAEQAAIDARAASMAKLRNGLGEIERINQWAVEDRRTVTRQAQVAANSVPATPTLRQKLTEVAEQILRDVTCDVVFSAMIEAEKAAAGDPTAEFPDAGKPAVEAIRDFAIRAVSAKFDSRVLTFAQWTLYANSVYVKVIAKGDRNEDKIVNNGEKVELPNWVGTRAFVYYAKFCLAPPK